MSSTQKAMSLFVLAISLVTVSFAQETKTDYDRNANFGQYKTFSFEKIQTKDPLWVDRIASAVSAALAAKGLTQVSSGGDISIVAIDMTREQLNTFYDNYGGGWGWRWGGGFPEATTTTDTYGVGTLVVDLFDAKNKKLIWRGSESGALSDKSAKNIKALDKGVDKLFKGFPPKA